MLTVLNYFMNNWFEVRDCESALFGWQH